MTRHWKGLENESKGIKQGGASKRKGAAARNSGAFQSGAAGSGITQRHAFHVRMGDLGKANMQELMGLSGIKEAKAISLLAAFELGRRIAFDEVLHAPGIHHPQDILEWVNQQIGFEQQEHFLVLFLNQKNQLISSRVIVGTLTNASVHPREIFREAMQLGCAKILCVHNHPSGDPQPSSADISLTRSIEECGVMTAIPLMDHIIVSRNTYFSFAQKGLLQPGLS